MTKRALTADRVTQSLYDEWVIFDGLHGDVACEIDDRTIDRVIATLRRDPRFAAVSTTDLELILADVKRDSAVEIAKHAGEHVTVDDIRDLASNLPAPPFRRNGSK
jgi:hypothetical protein